MIQHIVDTSQDIFPIVVSDLSTSPPRTVSFQGMGFLVAPNLLLTCWHSVETQLPPGQAYFAGVIQGNQYYRFPLSKIERDQNGSDLATAKVELIPRAGFLLSEEQGFPGTQVFTFGSPFPEKCRLDSGEPAIKLSPRFFDGYITRPFNYSHPKYGTTHSYELSFAAPQGLSGSPLITHGLKIIGVVYGNLDSYTITEEATKDPETGELYPEVRRIVSFGLAFHNDIVCRVCTTGTSRKPLLEFVRTRNTEKYSRRVVT